MEPSLLSLPDTQVFAHIGTRLRACREQSGLSIASIHDATGIDDALLHQIEDGTSRIHAAQILRLSACYNVTPNDLFKGLPGLRTNNATQEDVNHLVQNFLKVDQPNRGQLFKDFVSAVKNSQNQG